MQDELGIEFIPVKVVGNTGIELAKGEDEKQIMEAFTEQSDNLLNGRWLAGWKQFCEENKEVYIKAIANAYTENAEPKRVEMFAHYLYCEAHRDVWEELCKLSWETRLEP